ncbi:MAG: hypothetical protein AABW64_03405 [Nanoarchaeota archaeon]
MSHILVIINSVAVMLTIVSLVYVSRLREFEVREAESSMNAILFGIFFLLLIMISNAVESLETAFRDDLAALIPDIATYIAYISQIADLALAPLLAACFLIGVFLVRENAS